MPHLLLVDHIVERLVHGALLAQLYDVARAGGVALQVGLLEAVSFTEVDANFSGNVVFLLLADVQ